MEPTMEQTSSNKLWYLVGAVIIIALAAWYYAGRQAPSSAPGAATAASIQSEFNQIPDDSAALSQDQAASAQGVQGF